MQHHAAYSVGNIAERLESIIRLFETVLVVDVEVPRHRLLAGIVRVDGVVVGEGEELVEEFFNDGLEFLLVEGFVGDDVTAKGGRKLVSCATREPPRLIGLLSYTLVQFQDRCA